jgi:Fe2+ or Zn2+ uptake regulation protein
VFDLPGCVHALETLAPRDFQVQRHHIILYGVCADCAAGHGPQEGMD